MTRLPSIARLFLSSSHKERDSYTHLPPFLVNTFLLLNQNSTTTMSADLEFRLQELPAIQLTSLTLKLPSTEQESSEESCRTQSEQVEECVTPTSPEHRIPEILSCPPAPKKQRHGASPSCKRRLTEFQFFEVVARDEIDSFFKASYELLNRNSSKKRRTHAELSVCCLLVIGA
ncbi:unnamed protein product [Lactuca saligna]|uniref:Cyclin-dependent protein kinase inhibitor n=1 Tax=Lactuca saligna TaxID=75948 RepID=A0AA35ZR34_LACSI|nr:unnamed protein product [Lactuca saligna]